MNWRLTVAQLEWPKLAHSWAIEYAGRQAAIVKTGLDDGVCTLQGIGVEPVRFSVDPSRFDNTKARIMRWLGATE